MLIYPLVQYVKYALRAKNRHGIHSPFVYAFIEGVLMDREIIPREHIVSCPKLTLRFENILSRISAYYHYSKVVRAGALQANEPESQADMLLMEGIPPGQWMSTYDKYYGVLTDNSMVVVTGMHRSPDHYLAWDALRKNESVRMSIDLYGVGLLLFRPEFKERQHFVLRY